MLVGLFNAGAIEPVEAPKPVDAYVAVGEAGAPITVTTNVVAIGLTHVAEPATDWQATVKLYVPAVSVPGIVNELVEVVVDPGVAPPTET